MDHVPPLPIAGFPGFSPPFWLANRHPQTAASHLPWKGVGPGAERIVIPLSRGRLAGRLHRAGTGSARAAALLLHGVAGDGDEPYSVRTAGKLARAGIAALRLSLRGSGESLDCSPPVVHGGLTEDIRAAIDWLARDYARIGVVGFSFGGHLALKTACEWGSAAPREVGAVVAISPPLDLGMSARFLDRPRAAPYRKLILSTLRARYERVRGTLPPGYRALGPGCFREVSAYNASLVAPLFGYRSLEDYYARASSIGDLPSLAVPSLIIHAMDDPVVPVQPALEARTSAPASLTVLLTARGGHVGFFSAATPPGDPDPFWAENRAVLFLAKALGLDA